MGHVHCSVFAHLAASAPFRPPKSPPNSFVKTNLPVTPLGRIFCEHTRTYLQWNEDFRKKRGEGVPSGRTVPKWESRPRYFK